MEFAWYKPVNVNSNTNKSDLVKFENCASMQMCIKRKGTLLNFYSHAKLYITVLYDLYVWFCFLGISPSIYLIHTHTLTYKYTP